MRDRGIRDSEIVASIIAGDPRGLAAAYDKYADLIYTYSRSALQDPARAAEVVQDTFVIAASRVDALRDPEALRSWLCAVARGECERVLRKAKTLAGDKPSVEYPSPDDSELDRLLQDASRGLDDSEREAVELSLQYKLDDHEIASVLGMPKSRAHSLVSRARYQLEACVAVLLVARAGRDECEKLGNLLADWDGILTVLQRKRLQRHIDHCATCTSRRAFELRPAAFLGLSPLAALSAASRLLASPSLLKGQALAHATGTGPDAVAHRAEILRHVASFNRHGFPHLAHAKAGAAAKASLFLKTPTGVGTAAAIVIALVAASSAAALTGNTTMHVALSNGGHAAGQGGMGGGAGPGLSGPPAGGAGNGGGSGYEPAHASAGGPPSASPSPPRSPAAPSPAPTPSPGGGLSVSVDGGISVRTGILALTARTATLTLVNHSTADARWALAAAGQDSGAVTLSPLSGMLAPGSSTKVTVTILSWALGQTPALRFGDRTWPLRLNLTKAS